MDSGLVGLCLRGVLGGEFIISRSWLTLWEEVPLVSARPHQGIKNTANKKTCLLQRGREEVCLSFPSPTPDYILQMLGLGSVSF